MSAAIPIIPAHSPARPSLLRDVDDDDDEQLQEQPPSVWSPSSRALLSPPSPPPAPLLAPAENLVTDEGQDHPTASSTSSTAPFSSLLRPLPSLDDFLRVGEVGVEEDGSTASKHHPAFTFGGPDRSHQHQHSSSCCHHHHGHGNKEGEEEGEEGEEGGWAAVFDLIDLEASLPPAQPGVRAVGPTDYKYRRPPPQKEGGAEEGKGKEAATAAAAASSSSSSKKASKRRTPPMRDSEDEDEDEEEEDGNQTKPTAAAAAAAAVAAAAQTLPPGLPFVPGPAKQAPSSLESFEADLVRMLGPEQREALRLALDDEMIRASIQEGREGGREGGAGGRGFFLVVGGGDAGDGFDGAGEGV